MTKAIYSLIFLFCFSLANASNEETCGEIRLDQSGPWGKPGSLENFPIYDQGDTGLCYAYTASQLMNAYLKSKPDFTTKNPNFTYASPLFAAITARSEDTLIERLGRRLFNSLKSGESNEIGGGFICETVNAMNRKGVFDKEQVRDLEVEYGSDLTKIEQGYYRAQKQSCPTSPHESNLKDILQAVDSKSFYHHVFEYNKKKATPIAKT